MRIAIRHSIAAALLLATSACSESPTSPRQPVHSDPIDLAADWQTATPESQNIDAARLASALTRAEALPRLLSLLVVRHGKLVLEEYFNGNSADSVNDVRSVTKSVISTLVGIAVAQGRLPGVDVRIGDYLALPEMTETQKAITIRDLLRMSGGFAWDESTTLGYNEWILSGDFIGYLLRKPQAATPGTTFNYNSAAVHLLSVALQQAVGMPIAEFAERNLFAPLGITRSRWEIFPDGFVNGGSGLDLRPRDLAKLGTLWLQQGQSGPTRLLTAEYVVQGTTPTWPYWGTSLPLRDQSYGWLWWLTRTPSGAFYAQGHGGQLIYVVPALSLVVVATTNWRNAGGTAGQLTWNAVDLIVNRVLPAVR
jgi:CubicO group peptidase (beta-lactamase class C family)